MTLHEAIEYVIKNEEKPLTPRQIAEAINKLSLYKRGDGKPVAASQVSARVNYLPTLFEVSDVNLIYLKKDKKNEYQKLIYQLQDVLKGSGISNTELIIATCIFLARVNSIFPKYIKKDIKALFLDAANKHSELNLEKYQSAYEINKNDEEIISELFQHLSPGLETSISNLLSQYDFSLEGASHRKFGQFFNDLISSISLTKGSLGDFATPPAILKIITDLADIKEGETVFDPFGGNASLFCDIVREKASKFSLRLNDINKYTVWLGKMNLVLNNFTDFSYSHKDSIKDFLQNNTQPKRYDWIITHPPFGYNESIEIPNNFRDNFLGKSSNWGITILEMVLAQLNTIGKAIIVIPDFTLFSVTKEYLRARQYLVNNSLISLIVSLPPGAFLPYNSTKASILFLNKDTSIRAKEGVEFIDIKTADWKAITEGNEFSVSNYKRSNNSNYLFVTRKEIEEQGYSLLINRYSYKIESYPADFQRLRDIIKDSFSGFNYDSRAFVGDTGIPFINIKNLSDYNKHFYINLKSIDTFIDPEIFIKKNKSRSITNQSILLAKIGKSLKPTICNAGGPVAVSGNIHVITPDTTKVSPVYLLSQFYEEYVLKQIDRIRGGAAQPFVRINDLLDIFIKVPTLEEQREKELSFSLEQLEKTPKSELADITPIKEEIDLPSAIKHEYKNLKNPLSSNINVLKDFLDDKIKAGQVITWEDKIAPNNNARSVQTVFSDINAIMSEMNSLIDDIVTVVNLDQESALKNKKDVSALNYMENICRKIEGEFPDIQLKLSYIDRKNFNGVRIRVDDNLFPKVIRNFVLNSLRHGYDEGVSKKPVDILLSISEDKMKFEIDLTNDGKPFDQDFTFNDFISFGKKSGKSKGSGIGGFIMNQIILHHNGSFEMIQPNKNDTLMMRITALMQTGVHFRITLPINN